MAELDAAGNVVGFEEKPERPKSDLIPIGVYFLRPDAFGVIERLAPSGRGEFEITDVLNHYIPGGGLFSRVFEGHWTDAGTVPILLRAAEFAAEDDAAGRLPPPVQRPVERIVTDDRRSGPGPAPARASWSPAGPGSSARATSARCSLGATGPGSRCSTRSPTPATRRTCDRSSTIPSRPPG